MEEILSLGQQTVRVRYVSNRQARRYRMSLQRYREIRCTIPLRGTLDKAREFVARNRAWIVQTLEDRAELRRYQAPWAEGSPIWWRGEEVSLEVDRALPGFRVGPVRIRLRDVGFLDRMPEDLRTWLETPLRKAATPPLIARTHALAEHHGFRVGAVNVRNQQKRWGSCSRGGNISLNWRLIQVPPAVCDYVILHELAHLRHMNHSARFWEEVALLCPDFEDHEAWLKGLGAMFL